MSYLPEQMAQICFRCHLYQLYILVKFDQVLVTVTLRKFKVPLLNKEIQSTSTELQRLSSDYIHTIRSGSRSLILKG